MGVKIFAFAFLLAAVNSQENRDIPANAGKNIAGPLKICFNKTEAFVYRDNRFPTTMNVLIDLIRRIEDGKSAQDVRQFAIELIHRFRQDGIVKVDSLNQLSLPFSPDGYQADKNRLLLQKYLPGSSENFPEDSLTPLEKCSLHFMLSNTFELARRDNEDEACTRMGRFRTRTRRDKENLVETFPPDGKKPETANPRSAPRGYNNELFSRCPVESGVVYTKWGAVQAGTIIAAIVAGFEDQTITENGETSHSMFAATLAGDIAETALQQGIKYDSYDVGVSGDWKSVLVPRWYLMSENGNNLHEMTDAEIRADLDGLIIGKNVQTWKASYSSLKLSQILDMYYSHRGVFDSGIRACNRNELSTDFASVDLLKKEAVGFSVLYNNYASVKGTLESNNLPTLVEPVIRNFVNYYPKLSSFNCDVEDEFGRLSTEVTIVLDKDWPYKIIQPALSYFLDNLDINKFESNYTIINAKDGSIIVNASTSILDFHEFYNESVHRIQPSGFDLSISLPVVEERIKLRLENERSLGKSSGKSMIVLLVPYLKQVPSDQSSFVQSRISSLYKEIFPDLKVLVLGAGNKESYSTIASTQDDIYILSDTSIRDNDISDNMKKILNRVSQIPRRITNPKCGASMAGESSTTSTELYVEPGTINYYKISPNYFFGSGNRQIKIRVQAETITVCYSRSEVRPSKERNAGSCEDITAKEKIFDLTDDCTDTVSSCSPIYISVEAPIKNGVKARCTDCRCPDNIQFTITTSDFVCASKSNQLLYSSILLVATTLYMLF